MLAARALVETRRTALAAAVLPAWAVLAAWAWPLRRFLADEALVGLRCADRLLHGAGLTWDADTLVTGCPRLGWPLLLAALGAAGADLVTAARAVGFAAALVCFAAVAYALRARPGAPLWTAVALLGVSVSGPVGAAAIGGREVMLAAAALAWGFACSAELLDAPLRTRSLLGASVAWVGLVLVCETGVALAWVAAAFVWARHRRAGMRAATLLVLPPSVAWLGLWVVRAALYDDLVPRSAAGLADILSAGRSHALLLGLAATAGFAARGQPELRPRLALLAALLVVGGLGVFANEGEAALGDPAFVPLVPLLATAAAYGLTSLAAHAWPRPALLAGALALLYGFARVQAIEPHTLAVETDPTAADGDVLGEALRQATAGVAPPPRLGVIRAGAVPFASGLPATWLASPPARGDLLLLGEPIAPTWSDALRATSYQRVRFHAHHPYALVAPLWIDTGGRLGVRDDGERVLLPAPLLEGGVVAQLHPDGRLGALVAAEARVSALVTVRPGAWDVELDPPAPGWSAVLNTPAGEPLPRDDRGAFLVAAPTVRVALRAPPFAAALVAVSLVRRPDGGAPAAPDPQAAPGPYLPDPYLEVSAGPPGTLEPARVLASFEEGERGAFARREGSAFEQQPWFKAVKGDRRISGHRHGHVNTFHPERKDAAVGWARTEPFAVGAYEVLSLRIGGEDDRKHVGVALWHRERRVMTWTGRGDEVLREERFDLGPFAGETLTLEIFDRSVTGRILVDEIAILRWAPAAGP